MAEIAHLRHFTFDAVRWCCSNTYVHKNIKQLAFLPMLVI